MTQDLKKGQSELDQFGEPEYDADYEFWSKHDLWNLEEAVSLSMGKNPNSVNWELVRRFVETSNFARKFEGIRKLAFRAREHRRLANPVEPADFIRWATEKELEFPKELTRLVQRQFTRRKGAHETVPVGKKETKLEESAYWQKLRHTAASVVEAFPAWRAGEDMVQKTGNLADWIAREFGVTTRENEIIKKVVTDIYLDR